ncbi:MAG: putative dehydrogenase [Verrucomicrobiales bacterium]|jgi:predicted dehydrogenase
MKSLSRRSFARNATAAAGAAAFGFQVVPSRVFGANERPAVAGIGSGGKGVADIGGSAKAGCEIVGLVDVVDIERMGEVAGRFSGLKKTREAHPDAKFYTDYHDMLADLGDKVDGVTVSTPDHHHFHASIAAMKAGKAVYCQKPLTHGIWEARMLTELAAKTGVATQMGNQAHANDHLRRVSELIRAGIIGKIKEIHAWTNRPIWPQGFDAPPPAEEAPKWLDWEQWIGPAPFVEYSSKIAPFAWRGWWDYGTGAMGDMACHIMNMPVWAAELGAPTAVSAKQEGATALSPPINSTVTYEFGKEDVKFVWYDGQKGAKFEREGWKFHKGDYNRPDDKILEGVDYNRYESVIIGEKGKLFFARKSDTWFVKPTNVVEGFEWPAQTIPRTRGAYDEWVDAIKGVIRRAESGFHSSGPFTETVLIGTLAQRVPDTRLEWDAEKMEVKGKPELKKYIQREYRSGWEVDLG